MTASGPRVASSIRGRAFALIVCACACGAAGAQGFPGEKIEFASELRGKQETVVGYLSLPPNADRPVPAMILIHGSGGIGEREMRYTAEYNKLGIAVFAVDSFAPRGVASTVEDQSRVSGSQMVSDAFGALKLLRANPRIDGNRIGVQGGSKGGTVAIDTSLRQFARARKLPEDFKFAVHIPLYPACVTQYRTPAPTGAPMLVLLGARDDYVGTGNCLAYVEAMKKNGASNIKVIVYPNAEHDFDAKDGQRHYWLRSAQNYSKCLAYVEDDGKVVYAKTGEALDSPRKYYEVMAKDCMTRGASIATNDAAKAQSLEDIRDFLAQTLLKQQ
jgi:dienelactone hydrolase